MHSSTPSPLSTAAPPIPRPRAALRRGVIPSMGEARRQMARRLRARHARVRFNPESKRSSAGFLSARIANVAAAAPEFFRAARRRTRERAGVDGFHRHHHRRVGRGRVQAGYELLSSVWPTAISGLPLARRTVERHLPGCRSKVVMRNCLYSIRQPPTEFNQAMTRRMGDMSKRILAPAGLVRGKSGA